MDTIDLTSSPTPSPAKRPVDPLPAGLQLPPTRLGFPPFEHPPWEGVDPLPALPPLPLLPPLPTGINRAQINQRVDQLNERDLNRLVKELLDRSAEALELSEGILFRPKRARDDTLECDNCGEEFTLDDSMSDVDCTYHPGYFKYGDCVENYRGRICTNGCGFWTCCKKKQSCEAVEEDERVPGCMQGHEHGEMSEYGDFFL